MYLEVSRSHRLCTFSFPKVEAACPHNPVASFIFEGQVLLGMDVGVKQKDQARHGREAGSDRGGDLTNYISGADGIYMAYEMTISALAGNIYELQPPAFWCYFVQ